MSSVSLFPLSQPSATPASCRQPVAPTRAPARDADSSVWTLFQRKPYSRTPTRSGTKRTGTMMANSTSTAPRLSLARTPRRRHHRSMRALYFLITSPPISSSTAAHGRAVNPQILTPCDYITELSSYTVAAWVKSLQDFGKSPSYGPADERRNTGGTVGRDDGRRACRRADARAHAGSHAGARPGAVHRREAREDQEAANLAGGATHASGAGRARTARGARPRAHLFRARPRSHPARQLVSAPRG